jgi:chemotaxis regulatin CheY-phosphate phosphatase CheZ
LPYRDALTLGLLRSAFRSSLLLHVVDTASVEDRRTALKQAGERLMYLLQHGTAPADAAITSVTQHAVLAAQLQDVIDELDAELAGH